MDLLFIYLFCSHLYRVLQRYAEQGQDGFPRHVQKDVRNDVRTELVPVPGSVPGPGKILRRWQHEHCRGVGKLLLRSLSENVHCHEQPIYVRRQVSDFFFFKHFIISSRIIYSYIIIRIYIQTSFSHLRLIHNI